MTDFTKQSTTWSYTLHSKAWLAEMRDYPGPTSPPDLYLRQFDWAGLLVTSCFSGGQDYTVGRPSMWQVLWLAPLLFIELGSRYRGRILDPMEEQVSSIKSWYSTWYSILGTCQALKLTNTCMSDQSYFEGHLPTTDYRRRIEPH